MQRDRDFFHYQDLDLAYETRPSYFVETRENFGEGAVELVELPTGNETNDNIVAPYVPKAPPEPQKPFSYAYRLLATLDPAGLSPNGRTLNTYQTSAAARGSAHAPGPRSLPFLTVFSRGGFVC